MTTYFPDQPDMRPVITGYKLMDTFKYDEFHVYKIKKDKSVYVEVPKDYLSDGASVPRIVWSISGLTPDGLIRAAALIHDYLYEHKGEIFVNAEKVTYSKKEIDILFKEIMIKSGVPWIRAQAAYFAVRSFGWTYWALKKPIAYNE